jgi:hypothetical protein
MSEAQKARNTDALRVFLSYAAADKPYADRVRSVLSRRANLRIFTTESLSAGEDWASRLKDELSRCQLFVVVLSPSSVESNWILHELGAAWGLNKPIIPIVTDPEVISKVPLTLRGIKFVGVKELEKPEVVSQLLERYQDLVPSHKGR